MSTRNRSFLFTVLSCQTHLLDGGTNSSICFTTSASGKASPGGTSAEALYYLEKAGFHTTISRVVWADYQRSLALGKEKPGHIDTHDEE